MTCNECGSERETNMYGICTECADARRERVREAIRERRSDAAPETQPEPEDDGEEKQASLGDF